MLAIDIYLFGFFVGPVVWGVQMLWIPFWAAGIVNGVGHALGYRNYEVKDESRNISPIAIWLGGEELHNNHHADPKSARFAARWFEFDIGWVYIRVAPVLPPGQSRLRARPLKLVQSGTREGRRDRSRRPFWSVRHPPDCIRFERCHAPRTGTRRSVRAGGH